MIVRFVDIGGIVDLVYTFIIIISCIEKRIYITQCQNMAVHIH
jgi:hypothetical protein